MAPALRFLSVVAGMNRVGPTVVCGDGDWSAEELGMAMGMSRDEYERMVREHVETERQLERDKIEKLEAEIGIENTRMEIVTEEGERGDRDWDVVSVGSVDSIRLEDWEEITIGE